MRGWIWLCLIVLGAVACGAPNDGVKEPPEAVQTIQLGQPKFPLLADGRCQSGVSHLGDFNAQFWDGFGLQSIFGDLSAWQSELSLSSDLVNKTMFGYQELNFVGDHCQDRRRPSDLTDPFCRESRSVQNPGQLLKICESANQYERSSIEGSALTLAVGLDAVHRFYQQLLRSRVLEPLIIMLFPNIQYQTTFNVKDESRISFSITDNAAWGRRGSRTNTENVFYVFPMSQEYLTSRQNDEAPNFWEVPWIVAHEFAHHVFYNMLGPEARRYFGYDFFHMEGIAELPFHHTWQEFQSSAAAKEDQQLTALNEALADLFAHYYRGENSQEIAKLDCVFQQRNVVAKQLNDGRSKRFSSLLQQTNTNEPCLRVVVDDVHVQGSIYAHFFDQMLNLSPLVVRYNGRDDWKAEIWLHLLQNIAASLELALASDMEIEIWPIAVQSLSDVLAAEQADLNTDQCRWIDEVFGRNFTGFRSMTQYLKLAC